MSDKSKELEDVAKEATQSFLDAWTKRYSHTIVGKVLGFLGFGKK